MSYAQSFLFFLCVTTGTLAVDVHPDVFPPHTKYEICEGFSVELLWNFTVQYMETYLSLEWVLEGSDGRTRQLAKMDNDRIFIAFDPRVSYLQGNGIKLENVTVEDAGLIRNKIHFHFVGLEHERNSTVNVTSILRVDRPPEVENDELLLTMDNNATLDPETGEFAIMLRCGSFLYLGHPRQPPAIKVPLGGIRQLRLLDDNATYFALLSKTEIREGNYTCFIEQDPLCQERNITSSTVYIDEDRVHYILVNAAVEQSQKKLDVLRDHLAHIRVPVAVQADIIYTEQEYQKSDTIVFDFVSMNDGNGYKESTGIFTVPHSGLYEAYATAHVHYKTPLHSPRSMELVINSTNLMNSDIPFSMGMSSRTDDGNYVGAVVHGICYLKKGDTVVVRNVHPHTRWLTGTFIIGLLQPELANYQSGEQYDVLLQGFSSDVVKLPGGSTPSAT